MRLKNITAMCAVGFAVGLMTGCGVPEDEYNAKVGELNQAWAEIDNLKTNAANLESELKIEQAKLAEATKKLEITEKDLKEMAKMEADASANLAAEKNRSADLQKKLDAASAATLQAENRASDAEEELASVVARVKEIKENLVKLRASGAGPATATPSSAGTAPPTSLSALDLLKQMEAQ